MIDRLNLMSGRLAASVVLGLAVLAAPASAATLVVDGDLSDWGFHVGDNNTSTFVPNPSLNLLGIMVEDQDDNAGDHFFLGPYYGGQNSDAEVLAAAIQGNQLFIAIASGQRPDNGATRYSPADIRIDTATTTYAIETGGGVGGGPGSAITEGAPGSTYTIDGDGWVSGMVSTPGSQKAGTVWTGGGWFNWWQQFQNPGATKVGTADYIFTRDSVTTQHSIIELSLPLSMFDGPITYIGWGPACMNDIVEISPNPVPEPSTFALAGCGLVGLIAAWRKRRR